MLKEFKAFILRGNLVDMAAFAECLSEIPLEAKRCAFCTSEVSAAA